MQPNLRHAWSLIIIAVILIAPAAQAGKFRGHPYQDQNFNLDGSRRVDANSGSYVTSTASACATCGVVHGRGYGMMDGVGTSSCSGATGTHTSDANCPPKTTASLKVWVDDCATVTINGRTTKPQMLAGVHRGSRIFTLTGLKPGVHYQAHVTAQQPDGLSIDEWEEVKAGGTYEIRFPPMGCLVAVETEVAKAIEDAANRLETSATKLDQSAENLEASATNLEQSTDNLEASASNLDRSVTNLGRSAESLEASATNLDQSTDNLETSASNLDRSAKNLEASATELEKSATALQKAAKTIPTSTETAGNSETSTTAPKRVYEIKPEGPLAARLVYDETNHLVLSAIQFDGKVLPEKMVFHDKTDWKKFGLAPEEVATDGELTFTLHAEKESDPKKMAFPDGHKIPIKFAAPDKRTFDLKFAAAAEAPAKNIKTWLEELIAKNKDQAQDKKLFLSDQITSLIVKGTFKIGSGEPQSLQKDLEIKVLD